MTELQDSPEMMRHIQDAIVKEQFRFTLHGFERCLERDISPDEVSQAIVAGEIIEDYPEDKYGHSCLICGTTRLGRILHVQCSIEPVWIITAYDPTVNAKKWDDKFTRRRMKL